MNNFGSLTVQQHGVFECAPQPIFFFCRYHEDFLRVSAIRQQCLIHSRCLLAAHGQPGHYT